MKPLSDHQITATIIYTLACLVFSSAGTVGANQGNPYLFLYESLQGNWKGCAVKTPVGPRPYDILFKIDKDGYLTGMADPGPVSDHHWSYQLDGNVLWLRFLSTFRGNQHPTWLSAIEKQVNTVLFRSKHVRKLKVKVSVVDNMQNIEIFLHDLPHVSIRLKRSPAEDNSVSVCNTSG